MGSLGIVFRNFFRRVLLQPGWLLPNIGLPLGLVVLNLAVGFNMMGDVDSGVRAAQATAVAALFTIAFQFFSGEVLMSFIYSELRGPVSSRLFVSPVPKSVFLIGAVLASWVYNLVQAAAIFGISALVFDVRIGDPFVLVAVILIVSVMSQLLSAMISLIVSKRKTGVGIQMIMCFGFMFLSGALFIPLGNSAPAVFIQSYGTPLGLAWRAILYSGVTQENMRQSMINLGILTAITALLALIVFALNRSANKVNLDGGRKA